MPLSSVIAQDKREQVWIFGRNSGLDFNSGVPLPIKSNIGDYWIHGEASASVCNENGQLLLYTNGMQVFNKNYKVISNGERPSNIYGYFL